MAPYSYDPNRTMYPAQPQQGPQMITLPSGIQVQMPGAGGAPGGPNPWAYPGEPVYNRSYDPDTQSLVSRLQPQLDAIRPNTQGIDAYRKEALRTGPSAWASLNHQTQAAEATGLRQRMGREQAGATAGAESALAMRGGLTGGARERIARGGAKDYLDMSQDVGRQQGLNNLQIDTQDEQNRISQLGALPGMENQALQPQFEKLKLLGQGQQFDIGQQVAEGNRKNDWQQNIYNQKMGGYMAGQKAKESAAGGGSWLCTVAHNENPLSREEIRALFSLRRFSLKNYPTLARFYLYDCKPLIDEMFEQKADWGDNRTFIGQVVELVKEKKYKEALQVYTDHVFGKIKEFWPTCISPVYTGYMGQIDAIG